MYKTKWTLFDFNETILHDKLYVFLGTVPFLLFFKFQVLIKQIVLRVATHSEN